MRTIEIVGPQVSIISPTWFSFICLRLTPFKRRIRSPRRMPTFWAGLPCSTSAMKTGPFPRTAKPNRPLLRRRSNVRIREITASAGGTVRDRFANRIISSLLNPWTFSPLTSSIWSPGWSPALWATEFSSTDRMTTGARPPTVKPKASGHFSFVLMMTTEVSAQIWSLKKNSRIFLDVFFPPQSRLFIKNWSFSRLSHPLIAQTSKPGCQSYNKLSIKFSVLRTPFASAINLLSWNPCCLDPRQVDDNKSKWR